MKYSNFDIWNAIKECYKFATISYSKNRNSDQRRDASLCTDGYSVTSNNDEISLFDVADVDNAVFNKLKRGKAAGIDGVSPGHILYAHPCIIIHLKNLFNMILRHGYVPQYFGKGIVVPLIKDKNGDLSNPDNYRAIRRCGSIVAKN